MAGIGFCGSGPRDIKSEIRIGSHCGSPVITAITPPAQTRGRANGSAARIDCRRRHSVDADCSTPGSVAGNGSNAVCVRSLGTGSRCPDRIGLRRMRRPVGSERKGCPPVARKVHAAGFGGVKALRPEGRRPRRCFIRCSISPSGAGPESTGQPLAPACGVPRVQAVGASSCVSDGGAPKVSARGFLLRFRSGSPAEFRLGRLMLGLSGSSCRRAARSGVVG